MAHKFVELQCDPSFPSSLAALLAVLLLEVDEEVGVDLAPDLVARLGVRHALDHAALKVGGRIWNVISYDINGIHKAVMCHFNHSHCKQEATPSGENKSTGISV